MSLFPRFFWNLVEKSIWFFEAEPGNEEEELTGNADENLLLKVLEGLSLK